MAVAGIVALVYAVARPPLYERDGFVYQLLGRDFLGGTNPHHLLWNGLQALITRIDILLGIDSVLPFQLVGMTCGVITTVLLHNLLLRRSGHRVFSFAAAVFVALAPWTWFMAFQNQPYALMFLLFVVFLDCFDAPDGQMPHGARFAIAAASAVGMVALQQAAVLIVFGGTVCFLIFGGLRRAIAWAMATGMPTIALYVLLGALKGVRNPTSFWLWITTYLRSQHSLQTKFPASLAQSVMGVISAFINQEPLKEMMVDKWSGSTILWFYGCVGLALLVAVAIVVRKFRITPAERASSRPLLWISVASILSWSFFCVLWEPTNYYWFILLAAFFVCVAAGVRLSENVSRGLALTLCLVSAWNVYANHLLDAGGAKRAPEPQLAVIKHHLRPNDLLWVVDLGWSGDIDYDLLSTTAAFEHIADIRAISDIVGRSPTASAWQQALADSSREAIRRGGRVFLSDRVFDADSFDDAWEQSPFADYRVERPYPVDWQALSRTLPAVVERSYDILPAGFLIGSDTIWRLDPHAETR